VQWRGRLVHIRVDGVNLSLTATLESGDALPLWCGRQFHTLRAGEVWQAAWSEPRESSSLAPAA
jgi:hypothetical protein